MAKVADIGSGIAATEITANRKWLLAAYDPEAGTLRWAQDEDLPSGEVLLRFNVEDAAGNKTTAERRIRVGETTPTEQTH